MVGSLKHVSKVTSSNGYSFFLLLHKVSCGDQKTHNLIPGSSLFSNIVKELGVQVLFSEPEYSPFLPQNCSSALRASVSSFKASPISAIVASSPE
ncbi:hypothetical protein F2Q70_00004177 [Brassica cretica]|uniref:Uncharacterized protein n=1 Tax=Brassica cretica TaxID=69181 RepID=A0A8S9IPS0_BRACR|nr:hypothetical protein F2Q70_00004177 [Brassica cretica]